jgi:hypothetical protein
MRNTTRALGPALLVLGLVVGILALGSETRPAGSSIFHGPEAIVGGGTARLFVEIGAQGRPQLLGIKLTGQALGGLAERMNTTSRCHDKNGDGIVAHGECLGDYESVLTLPAAAADLDLPVRWATVNWNPEGHPAPAPPVWSAPHFDFHFFLADSTLIRGIRTGPCAEFIHCDDFARAQVPLPAAQLPEGYIDVGAAVAGMGNHLVDSRDPELADPSLGFSRTFIYGSYDGRLIFLEPMVSHAYLSSRPQQCTALRRPQAVALSGWYPTRYCVRYDGVEDAHLVTLEGLVYRTAGWSTDRPVRAILHDPEPRCRSVPLTSPGAA